MTNQVEKPNKKMPGDTLIGFGAAFAILGGLLFIVSAANGGAGGIVIGVLMLVVAFAFAVIGYLQRIAARK